MVAKPVFINSPEYDSRFCELIKALESCAYRNVDCGCCPVESDCTQLFDALADRINKYRLTAEQYARFMEHFKSLKKQLVLC